MTNRGVGGSRQTGVGFWKRLFGPTNDARSDIGGRNGADVLTGSDNVNFVAREQGVDPAMGTVPVVKEIYSAPNRATAIEFLRNISVDKRMFFIEIDTPEGRVGRDLYGIYDESGNITESQILYNTLIIVYGYSVPLPRNEDIAKTIAKKIMKDADNCVILCGSRFDDAISAPSLSAHIIPSGESAIVEARMISKSTIDRLFKYGRFSKHHLVYNIKLPNPPFTDSNFSPELLQAWVEEKFLRSTMKSLSYQEFRREDLPKIQLNASRESLELAISCLWGSIEIEICKAYGLELESTQIEFS